MVFCAALGIYARNPLSLATVSYIPDLKNALYSAVRETVPEATVGVAFSGGVDSSLLAKICQDLDKQTILITVGFPGSNDIEFSKKIAAKMGMPQRVTELKSHEFPQDLRHVQRLVGCNNTSHIENCIAYHYIARTARENHVDVVLSANGCDELFCGYNGYRAVFNEGESAIMKFMDEKISNELTLVKEIATVASEFGVAVRQPFLSPKFIEFAKSIPVDQKIRGADDMMRKHILRQVALLVGVPEESAMKPKKALQYGSLIHKHFIKSKKNR